MKRLICTFYAKTLISFERDQSTDTCCDCKTAKYDLFFDKLSFIP